MILAAILGGFVLLLIGGDLLVRGAVRVATALRVPPLVIGLTLVGFGTSMPELVTSVQAALAEAPGIAVGNVVGSNICNILLILGLAALIHPMATAPASLRRDGTVLAAVTLAGLAVFLAGIVTRWTGAAFLLVLLAYVGGLYLAERRSPPPAEPGFPAPGGGRYLLGSAGYAIGGIVLVILGGAWLVKGAVSLAGALGVSDTLIGLTIVAIGTSLPELVTSVLAAIRRQEGLAFGNVVGSNIFNILGILGVTALVRPIPIPAEIMTVDGWVMLAAAAALILFAATGGRLSRGEGAILLAGYAGYLGFLGQGA